MYVVLWLPEGTAHCVSFLPKTGLSTLVAVFINRWDTSCWWNSAVDLVEREVLKARLSFKYLGNRFVSLFYLKNTLLTKEEFSLFVVVRPQCFCVVFFSSIRRRKATSGFVRSSRIKAHLFDKMFRIDFVFRSICKIEKSHCQFCHACLSVHPFGATRLHWTDFLGIWYFRIFRKYVEKIPVWLKSGKKNGYFTWRPVYIYGSISLNYSWNKNCFRQNL